MLIRITTDNEVSIHRFPDGDVDGNKVREALTKLISDKCDLLERVKPRRLYTALGAGSEPTYDIGSSAAMLVDEDGILHSAPVNVVASYLYGTDVHGSAIFGNVLIVGEYYKGQGISFCRLTREQCNLLCPQLNLIAIKAKET